MTALVVRGDALHPADLLEWVEKRARAVSPAGPMAPNLEKRWERG